MLPLSSRARRLNDRPTRPGSPYVLYWMQQAQRAACNPALTEAILLANRAGLPVVVGFGLDAGYPEANERHFAFMLEGLAETAADLEAIGVRFVLRAGPPDAVALELAAQAHLVVCDRGYLRHQRAWRDRLAAAADRAVIEVETELVVPVETASAKAEVAARTLRPRIARQLGDWLRPEPEVVPEVRAAAVAGLPAAEPLDVDGLLAGLPIDRSVPRSGRFRGGRRRGLECLHRFLERDFRGYADGRSDPSRPKGSNLSPWLHFGQVGALEVALAAQAATPASGDDRASFLEELIVRRELAHNLVWYNPDYDRWEGLPGWARRSLDAHRDDPRPHRYDADALARGRTHDRYWNAAMREMRVTGYMHNYMRMYWGKKILEWSATPDEAFATALQLNNRYFLDGRDPNSYTGVAWCFGMHDRPWTERPIFGVVRYMNAAGLERKFDIAAYASWAERLEA
ncbi:MAG: deoxyribodipyrimidine photo-lyase [Geminicoccaceae bacterium]